MGLNNEDIKQLISILQRGLANDEEVIDEEPVVKKKRATKNNKTKQADSKTKRPNKFDQMAEKRMHKEDIEIDKKLNKSPPTPRRDRFKPLSVSCRVCGRTEDVDPSIIEGIERYKCNRCSSSAG